VNTEFKKKQLRKHKAIATSLFFLMALVYGLMVYFQHHNPQPWMGYVSAFSEAGMVGALADWFAVAALFRHPLGIPIPHTNLIERKKQDLGENLGKFVNENFLNPKNIRPYIERLNLVKPAAGWLENKKNQEVLLAETRELLKKILSELSDAEVEDFLTAQGEDLLKSIDYQKLAASGIVYFTKKEEHISLLESLLPQIKDYILKSNDLILDRLHENKPFLAFLAGKKISKNLVEGLAAFIEEIETDKEHFIRKQLTQSLHRFADDLENSDRWTEKIENLKAELITAENLETYSRDAWQAIKHMLQENLDNSDSALQEYLRRNIRKLAHNLTHDEAMTRRLNSWSRFFIYRMILKNREEAERLISSTVSAWEGRELSDKLELEVGKDLQFIRVNGTLVGGLVGLTIYVITHFFI